MRLRPLFAVALAGLALACTKVNEQPQAAPMAVEPPAPKKKPKRGSTTPAPPSWPAAPKSTFAVAAGPPDAAPVIDTLNGDPKGLRRDDLNRALDGALPALAGCFQAATGSTRVGISFVAEGSGRATNVKVSGGGAEGERCVTTTLAGFRVPPFEGRSVPVQFPISVQRPAPTTTTTTVAAPSPAPNAAHAAPAQPLFVKP